MIGNRIGARPFQTAGSPFHCRSRPTPSCSEESWAPIGSIVARRCSEAMLIGRAGSAMGRSSPPGRRTQTARMPRGLFSSLSVVRIARWRVVLDARGPVEKVVAVVLIVEDEALIRLNAMDFATDAGHEAIEAANADDAIRLLESRNDIDIVFSDVSMPGSMDGLRLIQLIRNRWPPIRLILPA